MTSPTRSLAGLASAVALVLCGCTADAGSSSTSASSPGALEVLPELSASEAVAAELEDFLRTGIDGFDEVSPPTDADPCIHDVAVYGADLDSGALDAEIGMSGDPACGGGAPPEFVRVRDAAVVTRERACPTCEDGEDSEHSRLVGLYGDRSPARFTYDFSGRFVPAGSLSG